jgi:hypothetical protein
VKCAGAAAAGIKQTSPNNATCRFVACKCARTSMRVAELQHPGKILSMPKFGLEKARIRLRESDCMEGDGPGRCERGDRGHDRDRAFREKG